MEEVAEDRILEEVHGDGTTSLVADSSVAAGHDVGVVVAGHDVGVALDARLMVQLRWSG